ncbi:MAG TPA: TIGR01777 family oxidoreductase [Polyangiaceae bacterium]|jgi:hypothetical protein|nr:TIGR01777 family oxidoreductase [Polyangiaceae bacterium]
MRVLLTGSTGFIGRELAKALSGRGDQVVAVSRRENSGSVTWDAVEDEVAKADAIVHLAGEPVAAGRWTRERFAAIRSSRVDTTARIARAIVGASRKPAVFVSGSAVGYYGTRADDRVLDEGSPPGGDELARVVVDWEAAASPASAVTRVVHPRTGIVLGRGGGALAAMTTPFKLFVGGSLGGGKQWLGWVHILDEVRALVFAIDHATFAGPFNVTAPEPVDMDAFTEALGHALHRPSAMRVPAIALKAALGRGLAETLLTGQRAAPRKLLEAGFAFEFPRLEGALASIFE